MANSSLVRTFDLPATAPHPDGAQELFDELVDYRRKRALAGSEIARLNSAPLVAEARQADEAARAKAVRASKPDPGEKHEEKRLEAIAAAEGDIARYNAAEASVYVDLEAVVAAAASDMVAAAAERLAERVAEYSDAFAAARRARIVARDAALDLEWWQKILEGKRAVGGARGREGGVFKVGRRSVSGDLSVKAIQTLNDELALLARAIADDEPTTTVKGFD